MSDKLTKPYNPAEHEDEIYQRWQDSGYFNPDYLPNKKGRLGKKFSIVLPPPNVTGTLHMGHAAMLTIQDILVRYHRMQGDDTLWLPGTDHAAIATQTKVESLIYEKEGQTRHDLGREEFLRRVEKFARDSHDSIITQSKKMGASLDWSREAYTLDDVRSLAVRTAFKRMYEAGLIYRGERLVNWDSKLQTTVSDDEVEWIDETVNFYYLKYGPFTIATARPETKFGDKYVVMHPDDPRYKEYQDGQKIELEWINGLITATIVKDKVIDMTFGTGVMTITPWHDLTDYEIASRHNLDKEPIIDLHGKLLPIAGEFAGLHIKKVRSLIIEKLRAKGLVERVDERYAHRIATNSRGGGVIEPQILKQWFVAVAKPFRLKNPKLKGLAAGQETTLKALMHQVVESGQIEIIPDHFNKIYYHWIDNLRDWCISRQIWYGHRIPAWFCTASKTPACREPIISTENITACPYCGAEINQDPDTLDTWFSSGLWTFSTLGWPEMTPDFKRFHPTSVLETAYDIIFFWVARMILMTGYLLEDIPFEKVYIHGLVRDEKGRKMSKSFGNIVDPLTMIGKYGADAVRLSLIIGTSAGNDSKLSEDKTRGYKNFTNKLWNMARFVETNTAGALRPEQLTSADETALNELGQIIEDVTRDLESFRFYLAGEKLYHYAWHTVADKLIENHKPRLKENVDPADRESVRFTLRQIFLTTIKMLHPFIPFATEAIWRELNPSEDQANLLMIQTWPTIQQGPLDRARGKSPPSQW